MQSRAKLAGHAVHPMLVVFPLGLFATSFIFDIIRMIRGGANLGVVSFYMIAAGVLGGLASAVFGFVDWLAIPPGTRARQVGALHGVGNVVVTGLFILSGIVRFPDPVHPASGAFILSLIGVLLALVTGWLGGELVERLGVGVDSGAHLDSPSSLSKQPATERWTPARPLQPRKA
jgi:uncharacterized membrane protein